MKPFPIVECEVRREPRGQRKFDRCPDLMGRGRVRRPTTAERLVERHPIGEFRLPNRDQPLLRGVERSLGGRMVEPCAAFFPARPLSRRWKLRQDGRHRTLHRFR
jgi:hypothetical protein